MTPARSLVILDRDGVINFDSPEFIKSPEEWIPIPGSLEAIATLNQAGFIVTIATNQSGLARGFFDLDTLSRIHEKMQDQLATVNGHIDAIFFCPHLTEDNCLCRKPKPGLIYQIIKQFNIDLTKTSIPMIGDSLRDLEAAKSATCKPILVLTGNGQKTLQTLPPHLRDIEVFDNLLQATQTLVQSTL